MEGKIHIIKPGIVTRLVSSKTDKDMFYGFPFGGPMCIEDYDKSNELLGNKKSNPVLECTLKAPALYFDNDIWIGITGEDMAWQVDGEKIEMNSCLLIRKGSLLSGGYAKNKLRSYISIGGLISDDQLRDKNLVMEDIIKVSNISSDLNAKKFEFLQSDTDSIIKIQRGPEWNLLDQSAKESLFFYDAKVSQDLDRMGARIIGSGIYSSYNELEFSAPTFPGCIQLLPSGQLIVLLQDAQTTGGYPRIAYMDRGNLSRFNQLMPGAKFEMGVRL